VKNEDYEVEKKYVVARTGEEEAKKKDRKLKKNKGELMVEDEGVGEEGGKETMRDEEVKK